MTMVRPWSWSWTGSGSVNRGDITAQVTQQASESSINRDSPQSLSWCHLNTRQDPLVSSLLLSCLCNKDQIIFYLWIGVSTTKMIQILFYLIHRSYLDMSMFHMRNFLVNHHDLRLLFYILHPRFEQNWFTRFIDWKLFSKSIKKCYADIFLHLHQIEYWYITILCRFQMHATEFVLSYHQQCISTYIYWIHDKDLQLMQFLETIISL